MAVVDEASIRITPDTSGFAAELRRELEAEIAAATAGLDDTIHIRVDVDGDAARARLAQTLQDFENDGRNAFRGLREEQKDTFDDIARNTEKTRDKVVKETEKTRNRVTAKLEPFWAKLKLKLTGVKRDFDAVKKAAEDAGAAAGKAFGGADLAKQENALAAAYDKASAAAAKMAAIQAQLDAQRQTSETRSRQLEEAEKALTAARENADEAVFDLGVAERALQVTREQANADLKDIQAGERDVAAARKEADAATKAAVAAENTLNGARERAAAAAAKVVVSEEKIETVRKKMVASSKEAGDAEGALHRAREQSNASAERQGGILGRLRGFMDGGSASARVLGAATGLLGTAFSAAGSAASGLTDMLGGGKGLAGILLQVGGAVLQAGAYMTAFLAIAGAVSFAVGAVGAALAGIPALALGAGAAIGVVALGIIGIKNAYNNALKPALDQLSTQVEKVFEGQLTPAFEKLAKIIPDISDQMEGLAVAVSRVAVKLIDMITQGENVRKINDIINNITREIEGQLTPALVNLVQQFINVAAQAPVMQAMVGIIADIVNNVAQWLARMQELNLLVPAVEALRSVLDNLVQTFFDILTAATNFFVQATPGFNLLVQAVGRLATALIGDLGGAFNTALTAAANFIDNIPPASLDAFKGAVEDLARAFLDFANSPAPGQIVDLITLVIQAFTQFVDAVTVVSTAIEKVRTAFDTLYAALGPFQQAFDLISQGVQTALNPLGALAGNLRAVGEAFGIVEPPAQQAGAAVDQFGQTTAALPGQVAPPMNNTATTIEESMRRAQDAARTGGQGVADGVTTPLPGMQQTTQVSFDTLPPVVQNAMVGAEAAASTGSNLVRTAVETGFNSAAQAATDSMNRLRDAVQQGFNAATNVAVSAMNGLQTQVIGAFQNMASVVQTNMDNIRNAVEQGAQAIQQAFQQVTQAAQNMQTAVQGSLTAMTAAFTASFTQINTMVTTTMTQVRTVIQQTMQQVQQNIQQSLQQILQNFQQHYQQLIQLTQQSWQRMQQIIQQAGQQIVQICRQIAQQILQVFVALAPQLEAAGNTMMQRLAAGITAGGAAAVAAARNVAAQIKAQFPASPAKEGPLSGKGDPLRTGGVIIQRLADGMRSAQAYLMAQLVPIMNATASVLRAPAVSALTGISISRSVASSSSSDSPVPKHLLTKPSSTPYNFRDSGSTKGGGWNASNGGIRAEDGSYVNPNFYSGGTKGASAAELRAALEGLVIRIDDRGNGLAKIVNAQQRSLSRR